MDKFQRLAHEIIDLVENAIRKAHPTIDARASQLTGNTLLHGENYYNLEDQIAEILRGT
jgi:hypothetical protein